MNKVILLGRICKDFDLKESKSGGAYCGFSLAVNRRVKKYEETQADFILCKCFGKTAEFAAKYFRKGSQIALTGHIQTGSYDKDGQKVYTTEIMVEEVFFADSKREQRGDAHEEVVPSSQPVFYPIDTSDDTLPF